MNLHAHNCRRREQGYVLLVFLLFVALLSVSLLGMVERFDFQIRRDREEELIHRGVQYSRAVRKFVKQFGRYPENIEELESTSNLRFLRKRYKDPVTGKDFRLLHVNELRTFVPVAPTGSGPDTAQQGVAQSLNTKAAASTRLASSATADPQNPQDNDQNGVPEPDQGSSPGAATPAPPQAPRVIPNSTPVLDGGPVVGVASISKEKTIREFNHKNHYNEWQFVYDPMTDNLASINAPNQPLKGSVTPSPLPGDQGSPHGAGVDPSQGNPPGGTAGQAANQ